MCPACLKDVSLDNESQLIPLWVGFGEAMPTVCCQCGELAETNSDLLIVSSDTELVETTIYTNEDPNPSNDSPGVLGMLFAITDPIKSMVRWILAFGWGFGKFAVRSALPKGESTTLTRKRHKKRRTRLRIPRCDVCANVEVKTLEVREDWQMYRLLVHRVFHDRYLELHPQDQRP